MIKIIPVPNTSTGKLKEAIMIKTTFTVVNGEEQELFLPIEIYINLDDLSKNEIYQVFHAAKEKFDKELKLHSSLNKRWWEIWKVK